MRSALILFALILLTGAAQARTVVDMAGRVVEVPDHVERVACLEVLCYEHMLMLGAAGRVVQMINTVPPWMQATNPAVATIPKLSAMTPDVEFLLARRADLAFFAYEPGRTLTKLSEAGIPALRSQPAGALPQTADAFAEQSRRMVRLFGAALGGDAQLRAEDWCAWFDAMLATVSARVAAIPESERVTLYYLRGPDALHTQGRNGYTYWLGRIAGARMVVADQLTAGLATVSMEDIVRLAPQAILVGRQYSTSLVLDDPRWRDVPAVRDGRVFPSPAGVFYWDGGAESALLVLFLAKRLYPDRFADIDLSAAVRAYYSRFYNVALSPDDAGKILRGEWPDGRRFNAMNN